MCYNVLMDNGQQTLSSQDSFASGITIGEGGAQDFVSTPNDLNMENFDSSHNYNGMGSVALNNQIELPMPSDNGEPVDLIMPPGGDGQVLGEIKDVPGAPVNNSGDLAQIKGSSGLQEKQAKDDIDPAIAKHFSDGKVDNDDIKYITAEVNKKSPVEVAKFIMKARQAIINGTKGEQK